MNARKIEDRTTQEVEEVIEQLRTAASDIAGYIGANDAANTLQPGEETNLTEVVRGLSKQIAALKLGLIERSVDSRALAHAIKGARFSVGRVAEYLNQ